MTMTDQEKREFRSFSAYLIKEHGIQYPPSDPLLPPLYVIHKETQLNIQSNKELAALIQQALSRINPKEFKFYSGEAAEEFQKGITFRWGVFGVLILMALSLGAWHWSRVNDVRKARAITEASGPLSELLKKTQMDNKAGRHFIPFTVNKGGPIQPFSEYIIINRNTIGVYIDSLNSN